MKHTEVIAIVALTAISVIASVLFMAYGGTILLSDKVPTWILVFAFLTLLYGTVSMSLLIWSWVGGGKKAIKTSKISAISYFAIYIIGSMDVGIISGQELVAILSVGVILLINWHSMKKVALWRAHA